MEDEKLGKEFIYIQNGEDGRTNVSTSRRIKEMSTIRIYEDKKLHEQIDNLERMIKTCWKKEDIIIKMLTRIGYRMDK